MHLIYDTARLLCLAKQNDKKHYETQPQHNEHILGHQIVFVTSVVSYDRKHRRLDKRNFYISTENVRLRPWSIPLFERFAVLKMYF